MDRPRVSHPRHQRADAQANRERILRAAREVFAELGPEASFHIVGQRAGVGQATLYRHFTNAEELRKAVVTARFTETAALLDDLATLDDPWEELTRFLQWVADSADLSLAGTAITDLLAPTAETPGHEQARRALENLLQRAHIAGVVKADIGPAQLRVACYALVHVTRNQAISPDQRERFITLVLDGLRA